MNPMSFDAKARLVAASVGTWNATSGWSIQIGVMMDSPDTAICLYDSPGEAMYQPYYNPSVPSTRESWYQVIVRGTDYETTYAKCYAVIDAIHQQTSSFSTTTGSRILESVQRSGPFYLGRDEKQRHEFSINFKALREKYTPTT